MGNPSLAELGTWKRGYSQRQVETNPRAGDAGGKSMTAEPSQARRGHSRMKDTPGWGTTDLFGKQRDRHGVHAELLVTFPPPPPRGCCVYFQSINRSKSCLISERFLELHLNIFVLPHYRSFFLKTAIICVLGHSHLPFISFPFSQNF